MKEAMGVVINRQFAGARPCRSAVQLDDSAWYWLPELFSELPAGQKVRVRYVEGDQFCELVESEVDAFAQQR
jgi:hypothetical protein